MPQKGGTLMARIKTGLLIALVIISGYLATLLMSGQPVFGPPGPGDNFWFGPEPALFEASLPGRIYIINAQEEVLLVETFSGMYDDLTTTLALLQYESGGGGDWSLGEYNRAGFPPGVLFRYDYQISREMLASWLKVFFEPNFPFAAIDSIFIPLEAGPVHFINSSTGETWLLSVSLPREVVELAVTNPRDTIGYRWNALGAGENYAAAAGVYEISEPEVIVVPAWDYEEVNYEALVHSFYMVPSLIQEADGTEIYTDGLQALRIYPSGAVEYTFAGYERDVSMPPQKELLEASLRFISVHGGWPGNMLPTELGIRPAQNVRLGFSSYGLGLPVLGDTGLAIEMKGLTVSEYYRNLITIRTDQVGGYAEILPLSQLLSSPSTQVAKFFSETNLEIADLALVYYLSGEQLIPAWRIWSGRQEIFVGAGDGRILSIKEQARGD